MWNTNDEDREISSQGKSARAPLSDTAPTRTILSVVLTAEVEKNADVIACTVEAIQAFPCVANVTTRKVRTRAHPTGPERTR